MTTARGPVPVGSEVRTKPPPLVCWNSRVKSPLAQATATSTSPSPLMSSKTTSSGRALTDTEFTVKLPLAA
jgi:hypothetical protein